MPPLGPKLVASETGRRLHHVVALLGMARTGTQGAALPQSPTTVSAGVAVPAVAMLLDGVQPLSLRLRVAGTSRTGRRLGPPAWPMRPVT